MIELKNVSKVYDNGSIALDHVSLHIGKGEFVFVVGASGAGKSTLIKLLSYEELPSRGSVFVNGIEVNKLAKNRVPYLRRKMGIVFQDFRLLPNKTAQENVAFAMEVTHQKKKDIRRKVPVALSLVGLSHKAKSYPSQLSGGEQQRVGIARAIINSPLILIADEPTGNLDPHNADEIMKLLQDINRRGTTVIVATHAKEIVDKLQKRVITLEEGRILSDVQRGNYTNV